jgi:probable rRNA maturation factor
MSLMTTFNIISTVKNYPEAYPYEKIKETVVGKKYQLSLVFVGSQKATTLNQQSRGKDYTPNVLSYPLTDETGEIFICPTIAKKEAHKFNLSYEGYVAYLFIHGLLHLKGYDHGDKMEKLEHKYVNVFNIS